MGPGTRGPRPLGRDDVAALVESLRALPREPWAGRFPDELHAATGGSPLLVLETLQKARIKGRQRRSCQDQLTRALKR